MVAPCPPRPRDILAELDRRPRTGALRGLLRQRPAGARADEVQTIATGVSAHAELFELAASRAGAAAARPPRPVLGLGRSGDRRAAQAPPADPVRRGHRAGRLPPAARRAPRARQQRAARAARSAQRRSCDALRAAPRPADRLPRRASPATGCPRRSCSRACASVTAREPLVFDAGPARVRRLAIVSGAGADYIADAAAAGADALLTGEPAERAMAQARESGVHLIAAGHYATETFGVRRLGEHARRALRAAPRLPRRAQPRVSVGDARAAGVPTSTTSPRRVCNLNRAFRLPIQDTSASNIIASFRLINGGRSPDGGHGHRVDHGVAARSPT